MDLTRCCGALCILTEGTILFWLVVELSCQSTVLQTTETKRFCCLGTVFCVVAQSWSQLGENCSKKTFLNMFKLFFCSFLAFVLFWVFLFLYSFSGVYFPVFGKKNGIRMAIWDQKRQKCHLLGLIRNHRHANFCALI